MDSYPAFKNSKLCKGGGVYYIPCEYIESCKVCVNYAFDERQGNNNELYRIFDKPIFLCKRDFPDFKPFTIQQFKEMFDNGCNKQQLIDKYGSYENLLKELQDLEFVKN